MYHCKNQQEFPVYFDVELINPDGSISPEKGIKIPLVEEKPDYPDLFYAASKTYCWIFDKDYKNGNYTMRITIYSATKVIVVFEMGFVIEL